MVLIQLLLPTKGADGAAYADELLTHTRQELLERFGGLTAYLRSPAAGAWTSPSGRVDEDAVVMVEVLAPTFDVPWWRQYAGALRERFQQESLHVRASEITVLDS